MKKFYAFAAAAFFAVAANAQNLYITGEGQFANGTWNAETPDAFAIVDGNFEIEVAGLTQFKISTACGDWDSFNAGVYGCAYGEETGVAVNLEAGYTENIVTPWKGDYKIVVSGDLKTITLTTETPKPEGPVTLYIRGDMNGWCNEEADRPAWALETITDGKLYKFVFGDDQAIKVGETFKIADADWNAYNIGGLSSDLIMLDTDTEVVNGGNPANMSLEEECNGVMWLTLDLAGSAYAVFSNDKAFVPEWAGENAVSTIEVSNGEAQYFNLQGVRVANPENGLYIVVKDGKSYKTILK